MSLKVCFLDRDGTLNVDQGYAARADALQLLPGVPDGLRRLQDAGFKLAVVTNQAGVGRGWSSTTHVLAVHARLRELLEPAGVILDTIVFCPHTSEAHCGCRKPRTGLARIVEETLQAQFGEGIDYGTSWVIGDKDSDVEFGRRICVWTVFLGAQPAADTTADVVASTFRDAVDAIIGGKSERS